MKREDIEKAASEHSASLWNKNIINCSSDFDLAYESFFSGVEWYVNSIWHKDISKGEARKVILVQFDNGLFNLFEDIRDLKGIEDKVKAFAYIEDLIPNTEE